MQSAKSFADLGVSEPVADALAERGIAAPFAVQELVIEDVLDGHDVLVKSPTGSGKTLAFGVPIVDMLEAGGLPVGADPRADARARHPDRRRARRHRPLALGQRRRRLRRRRHLPADQGRQARRHHRRHARPPDRPARPPRRPPRPDPDARPRRGRPHARHGLQARRRPHRRRDAQRPPDAALLAPRSRARSARIAKALHPRRPCATSTRRRSSDAARSSTASSASPTRPSGDTLVEPARRQGQGRTLVFVRTKRGADRLAKRLAKQQRHRRRHARRQVPGPARARPGELRVGQDLDADRHGRRRPRHRRRRHHARHQLRPAGRAEDYVHRIGRTARAGADGVGITFVCPRTRCATRSRSGTGLGLNRELAAAGLTVGGPGGGHRSPPPRQPPRPGPQPQPRPLPATLAAERRGQPVRSHSRAPA